MLLTGLKMHEYRVFSQERVLYIWFLTVEVGIYLRHAYYMPYFRQNAGNVYTFLICMGSLISMRWVLDLNYNYVILSYN